MMPTCMLCDGPVPDALRPCRAPNCPFPEEAPKDPVNLPDHYAHYKHEPIRFIVENELPFMEGNAVKYILRHRRKNGAEDIRKGIRYLEMILKYVYGKDPDWWKGPE